MSEKISIFPILLVNFIGTLGYSIVLPFLVIVVIEFGGNELIYGALGASYSFFQLIGAPILGKWSDKVGRRKILLLSQAGTFCAWIIFLLAFVLPNLTLNQFDSSILGSFTLSLPLVLLFGARALDGITGGNVSVANAYLADVSTENDRKKNFGKMSASANLGFIVGPALAGVLGATLLGNLLPVLMAMLISFLAIFVIYFKLQDYDPCVLTEPTEGERTRKILGQEHKECHTIAGSKNIRFRDVLGIEGIPLALVLYFLIFLAFNFFYVAFPIHAIQTLGWDLIEMGVFFTVMSGTMILVQGPVLSKISKRFSDDQLVLFGNLVLAIAFYLFTFQNDYLVYCAVLFFSLGNGLMWPSFLSILSSLPKKSYQGAVQGFASSTGSLASILGLLLGAVLYSVLGTKIFLLSVITFVLISGISILLIKKEGSD